MLGNLPVGVSWNQLPIEYIAVSHPVAWFLEEVLDLRVKFVLPPVVQDCFFLPDTRPQNKVRVAWMPRKNRAVAGQVQQIALYILRKHATLLEVEWVSLHDLTYEQVAAELSSCHIFLVTSFAEGFGLPPIEAMASGCVPVGFSGLGGWEYMRTSDLLACCNSFNPSVFLPKKPWGPNGFYVADGDIISAGLALAGAIKLAWANSPEWKSLAVEGRKAAADFTKASMRSRLEKIWP
jgi:glycosyltransferase involved in cell wall biosynthesis